MGPVEVLWDGDWVPQKGQGTSGSIMGWKWVPTGKDMGPVEVWGGDGVPCSECGQTHTCENSTFPSYYVRGR